MIVPEAAPIDLVAVATTDPVPRCRIWIAKHRIGRVVVKRANASKTFNAAAAIAGVAAEDSAAVASVEVVGSGGVDDDFRLEFTSNFPYNQKLNQPTKKKNI